jgi:hypothetical protein
MTKWQRTNKFDLECSKFADRHYNRQKKGSAQFAPPGHTIILKIIDEEGEIRALWISLCQRFIDHYWKNSWNNCLFRNEGAGLSSTLIIEAVSITRAIWDDPPTGGIITFINPDKIRKKRDPGRCYKKAGFSLVGKTKIHRRLCFQLKPDDFPPAMRPDEKQGRLFDDADDSPRARAMGK